MKIHRSLFFGLHILDPTKRNRRWQLICPNLRRQNLFVDIRISVNVFKLESRKFEIRLLAAVTNQVLPIPCFLPEECNSKEIASQVRSLDAN